MPVPAGVMPGSVQTWTMLAMDFFIALSRNFARDIARIVLWTGLCFLLRHVAAHRRFVFVRTVILRQ